MKSNQTTVVGIYQFQLTVCQSVTLPIFANVEPGSQLKSPYYKILSKKRCLQNKVGLRDEKWHVELQAIHSVDFWDGIRKLNASISFNNNIKWLQFQIIRNSLQTNYIVSHFIRTVSHLCKYCNNFSEKISHLYWDCVYVKTFLNETFQYISSTGLLFDPTKTEFIFGNHKVPFYHSTNYLSQLIRFWPHFLCVPKIA